MAVALDPGIIFGCLLAIGFIYVSSWFLTRSIGLLDISLPLGIGRPFHGVVQAIINAIESGANDALKATEKALAWAWADLLSSLQLFLGLTIFFGDLLLKALSYMWLGPLPALISRLIEDAFAKHRTVPTTAPGLESRIVTSVEAKLAPTLAQIRADSQKAEVAATNAEKAADAAAAQATHSVTNTIEQVVTNPVTYLTNTVTEVIPGLAEALTAAGGEVADLPGLTIPNLEDLLRSKELGSLAGLMAAIPLLRAITNTIAVESGLENADCRSKVKGICGTNPAAWAGLLGGLAALGFAFSLKDLYGVAEGLVHDLSDVIQQAA